jgi:hypothetical protein
MKREFRIFNKKGLSFPAGLESHIKVGNLLSIASKLMNQKDGDGTR